MDKRILLSLFGVVIFLLIPNPVMGQVANYGFNTPKPSYVQSTYGIPTCVASFQYKFLCDRIDVMIQQNDKILNTETAIKAQNEDIIRIGQAQVCMTGYSGHTNFYDYAKYFGVNCNVGKP